jgi:hypothetical protein
LATASFSVADSFLEWPYLRVAEACRKRRERQRRRELALTFDCRLAVVVDARMPSGLTMIETRTELEYNPPESLFQQLFGSRSHIEVNVSKAFAACFRESPTFANAVARLLCTTCDVTVPGSSVRWHCDTEVSMAKGRPDFEIYAPGVASFRLESKVGAVLTKNQLGRYRCVTKGHYLIAVTKRPPDVGRAWIEKNGAFSIRWQDVHRAVAGEAAKGRERYLRDSFCLYLEELGMAHRENVRPDDMGKLYALLRAITSTNRSQTINPGAAFDAAESCLHLLREVARDAKEQMPNLQNWSRRGPHYAKWFDREHDRYWHHLGFFFHKSRGREQVGAGFSFLQEGHHPKWEVWRHRKKHGIAHSQMSSFRSVCGKGGSLDRGRMLDAFVRTARRLGIK